MAQTDPGEPQRGWRERKKAKTKAAIQHHALRLFLEQGYEATTIEQIAEQAEISPSTFFRYFPKKEDVVLYDELDPLLFAAFAEQPDDLHPISAMRRAFRQVFMAISDDEMAHIEERARLVLSVPELRMLMLDQIVQAMHALATVLARRLGRDPDDFAARSYAGAVIGVFLATLYTGHPDAAASVIGEHFDNVRHFIDLLDAGLAYLEQGMPLS